MGEVDPRGTRRVALDAFLDQNSETLAQPRVRAPSAIVQTERVVDGAKAAPALEELSFFKGGWEMERSHAAFLTEGETVKAAVAFKYVDDGRFLALRQGDAATWVIGRDDGSILYTVLYSDARGVSRVYAMTLERGTWKIWRDD